MQYFLNFLSDFGPWGASFVAAALVSFFVFGNLYKADTRDWWVAVLRRDGFTRSYKDLLAGVLDLIDRRLSPAPEFPDAPAPPKTELARAWSWQHGGPWTRASRPAPITEPARAWSWRLLDLSLLIAVAYPILSVFTVWAVTGDDGRLAGFVLIPAYAEDGRRIAAAVLLLIAACCCILAIRARSISWRLVYMISGYAFAIIFALSVADIGADVAASIVVVAGAVIFAGSLTYSGAFVGISIVTGAVGVAFSAGFAGPFAGAFAFAAASACTVTQELAGRWSRRRTLVLLIFSAVLFSALVAVVEQLWSPGPSDAEEAARATALFLGFLPLLSAWTNFLSVGRTRWFLRKGLEGNLILYAIFDAVLAWITPILFAFALIATAHWVRPAGGTALFDLHELFADLRSSPGSQYYWLYFCLFAMLLPTALHLSVACLGLFTLASGWLGRPIAAGLMAGDTPAGRLASLGLALFIAVGLWLPPFVIWQVLVISWRPILDLFPDLFLQICENFARLIGAL